MQEKHIVYLTIIDYHVLLVAFCVFLWIGWITFVDSLVRKKMCIFNIFDFVGEFSALRELILKYAVDANIFTRNNNTIGHMHATGCDNLLKFCIWWFWGMVNRFLSKLFFSDPYKSVRQWVKNILGHQEIGPSVLLGFRFRLVCTRNYV